MKHRSPAADPHQLALRARVASAHHDAALAQAAQRESDWHAAFDGSAVGGHGRMGVGGVLYAPDGAVHTLAQALPGQGCNNEAELRALIAVLDALRQHGARRIHVWGDSDLAVRQLRGEHLDKAQRLAPLREQMRALAQGFEAVAATWVPRQRNGRADALAAQALRGPLA